MRKYAATWLLLKTTGKVELTVSKEAARRILQGIKVEKSTENVARKSVGLMGWSELVIAKEEISPTMLKITLTFLYATAL